jgi:surface antigen
MVLSRVRNVAVVLCLLISGGAIGGTIAGSGPAAAATSATLCKGYAGCTRLDYPNAGYQAKSSTMFWRMYAGHNCTNYVAYRMIQAGMSSTRPWSGSGNATNWGVANSKLTDTTPRVGAVAWWRANVPGAGSAGHVAFVEQVISANEIIVSQDSWGGDFSWARINRSGGRWPSGFIHFRDVPLTNVVKPAMTGTAKVGSQLKVSAGTWTPSDATITYQWLADGAAIAKATTATLSLTPALQAKKISAKVTATRYGFPVATVTTPASTAVAPGVITATVRPTVTGDPKLGAVLSASSGTWSPAPTGVAYQWSADGTAVAGATTSTLTMTPALVGKKVAVTVTASKTGYPSVAAASLPTVAVKPGIFATTTAPSVTGTARYGQTLTLRPGAFTGSPAVAVQWLRGDTAVPGATGPTYQLGAADLGTRITARLTLTQAGYTTATVPTAATAAVDGMVFPAIARPTVAGVARNGSTLTLRRPKVPAGTTVTVQWLRGSTVVPGATGATYRLRAADLGSRMSARIVLQKPLYQSTTSRSPLTAAVRSLPNVRVALLPGRGRLRVTVNVTAPGVTVVTGTVRIRSGGELLAQQALVGGSKAVSVALKSGRRTVRVSYLGSSTVLPAGPIAHATRIG